MKIKFEALLNHIILETTFSLISTNKIYSFRDNVWCLKKSLKERIKKKDVLSQIENTNNLKNYILVKLLQLV